MKISNRKQLHQRISAVKSELEQKETALVSNFKEFKSGFTPQNIILNSLGSLTGINLNKKEFIRNGIMTGLSLVIQRFVFKTEANLEKKAYNYIDTLFKKIDHWIRGFSTRSATGVNRIETEEEE